MLYLFLKFPKKTALTRHTRSVLARREVKHAVGIVLIAVLTATFLISSLQNIGGRLVLAFETPKVTIDATTKSSAQVPLDFQYESRGFSWYHAGADLVAPTGTQVKPIMPGRVELTKIDRFGFGRHVILKHEGGYESIYGHLSKITVKEGQEVDFATKLGEVGSTGFSTGPHLHLEIYQNGSLVNPADIVPGVK